MSHQLVTSFCTKKKLETCCASFRTKLFSLFLSIVLHSSSSLQLCSSFFLHTFYFSSLGDDHGRINNQSIQGSNPRKAEFEFWFSISILCECSSSSSILFFIFMIINVLSIENKLGYGFIS